MCYGDSADCIALDVGEHCLNWSAVKEARQDVAGVTKHQLHVNVCGRLVDGGHVATLCTQVGRDLQGGALRRVGPAPRYLPAAKLGDRR